MRLPQGQHLAYCTNIHRGETWAETMAALETHTLAVRAKVAPEQPFAIGLRLGEAAARELSDPPTRAAFRHWLDRHNAYIFTINGFPYGSFHGTRVKERVYQPDWTTPERLAYTNRLFDLLAELVPVGVAGSVSTLPGSFKGFNLTAAAERQIRDNLFRAAEYIAKVAAQSGKELHLGLEPEPLCWLETTPEAIQFFEQLRAEHPGDDRVDRFLGINYDCCHLALEYEEAATSLGQLQAAGIKISKLHLSAALKTQPIPAARWALTDFNDPVYLHQVIARQKDGSLRRFTDLPEALLAREEAAEWRIHFHVPLHAPAVVPFQTTADHTLEALKWLAQNPGACTHLEMETYTWEVMPPAFKAKSVVDQLAAEYAWTLVRLKEVGLF